MAMKKKSFLILALTLGGLCLTSCDNFTSSEQGSSQIESSETSKELESSEETSFTSESNSSENDNSSENSSSSESTSSSENSSSSNEDKDPTWNVDLTQFGNSLRISLGSAINAKRTKTISYSDCLSVGAKAAAYPAGSSTFVPFYHDETTTATKSQCNREHTWPNSRGTKKVGPGADPFIIRPTLTSENSSRGNYFYGISSSNEWDPASCGFEAARGESARVILYTATAYYKSHGFELSNNPKDDTSKKTMGTLKTLLEWNKAYAPTKIEIQVNEYLSKNGYGRNPFVDHPEYANRIWNKSGIVTSEAEIEDF